MPDLDPAASTASLGGTPSRRLRGGRAVVLLLAVCVGTVFAGSAGAFGGRAEAGAFGVGEFEEIGESQEARIRGITIRPLVVPANPISGHPSESRLELLLDEANPDSVIVELDGPVFERRGEALARLVLHDGGAGGDALAGDSLYTSGAFRPRGDPTGAGPIGAVETCADRVRIFEGGAATEVDASFCLKLRVVDLDRVEVPETREPAPGMVLGRRVVSMAVDAPYPIRNLDLEEITRRYYEAVGEPLDFLVVADPYHTESLVDGSYVRVKNEVRGIGVGLIDRSETYGTTGRLRGVIRTSRGHLGADLLTHELLHAWAAYLDPDLHLTDGTGHWGALERPETGFGPGKGGFEAIEPQADGTYLLYETGTSYRYSDLELYLMGLLDSAEVATPIRTLVRPEYGGDPGGADRRYRADRMDSLTVGDIVAVHGVREPSVSEAQRQFRVGLLVPYDRPLEPLELAYYDFFLRGYARASEAAGGTTFEEATGFRAELIAPELGTATAVEGGGRHRTEPDTGRDTASSAWHLERAGPNPARRHARIAFELPRRSAARLELYDVLGRRVRVLHEGPAGPGRVRIEVQTAGLAPGIYVYRLEAGGRVRTRTLSVVR